MSDIDILGLYLGIRQRAVRWEGLQTYRVPWEDDQLAAWRRGEPPPPNPEVAASLETIRRITDSGRRILRIRGFRRPPSEYTRYEIDAAYPLNVAAGEEILAVDLDVHSEFDGIGDFVIFDTNAVIRYLYDADGRPLGYDFTDHSFEVADCAVIADRLLAAAAPLAQLQAEAP